MPRGEEALSCCRWYRCVTKQPGTQGLQMPVAMLMVSLRQEFRQAQRAASALLHNNWGPGGETRRLGPSAGSFIPMSGEQLG